MAPIDSSSSYILFKVEICERCQLDLLILIGKIFIIFVHKPKNNAGEVIYCSITQPIGSLSPRTIFFP